VVPGSSGNLLSFKTIVDFHIINFVNSIEANEDEKFVGNLIAKYPSVFSDKIGKLKNHLVKIHINRNVKPIRQKRRPTPIHLRPGIEKAIKQMLENDVIETVDGLTPWVSPIVPIVKNSGEIRICTDAKLVNTAIMREVHHTPTIEELATELNGAKIISKLDLRSAYNQ
jgi:phage-related protein